MLHADTLPPAGADAALLACLAADASVVGGAFRQRFATRDATAWQRRQLHLIAMCNRMRYAASGVYVGDQAIFARPAALMIRELLTDSDRVEIVQGTPDHEAAAWRKFARFADQALGRDRLRQLRGDGGTRLS